MLRCIEVKPIALSSLLVSPSIRCRVPSARQYSPSTSSLYTLAATDPSFCSSEFSGSPARRVLLMESEAPRLTFVAKRRLYTAGTRSQSHRIWASTRRGIIAVKSSSVRAGASSLERRYLVLPRRSGPPTHHGSVMWNTLGM